MSGSLNFYQKVKTICTRLVVGMTRGGVVIALLGAAFLVIIGFLLISFPLETIVVSLLVGSILVMERG